MSALPKLIDAKLRELHNPLLINGLVGSNTKRYSKHSINSIHMRRLSTGAYICEHLELVVRGSAVMACCHKFFIYCYVQLLRPYRRRWVGSSFDFSAVLLPNDKIW